MMNGLAGFDMQSLQNPQSLNVQTVANANTVLNQAQLTGLMQSLNSNPQARQAAQALTQRLRADGRIRPDQEVIGFQNGQVFVTTMSK